MVCKNCGQAIPEGVSYCTYCGAPVQQENTHSMAQNISAPNYGLVPENPIFVNGIEGEKRYLNSLRTIMGHRVVWSRQGSMAAPSVQGLVDVYKTSLPSGEEYKTLYLNMYSAENSTQPPAGFFFEAEEELPKTIPVMQEDFIVQPAAQENVIPLTVPAAQEIPPTMPVEPVNIPIGVNVPLMNQASAPVMEAPQAAPVAAPVVAPVAAPMIPPVPPVVENRPVPASAGKSSSRIIGMAAMVAAAVLLVATVVLGINVSNLKGDLEEATAAKQQLKEEKSSLQAEVDQLEQSLAEQQLLISDLQPIVDEYNAMYEELGTHNLGSASYYFQATEKIMVIRKGDTNRKFTLTAYWRNGGNVNVEYSSPCATVSFDRETWVKTVQMTVIPKEVGFTVATFSNTVDSNTFSILILVVE